MEVGYERKKTFFTKGSLFCGCIFYGCGNVSGQTLQAAGGEDSGNPGGPPATASLSHNNWDGRSKYDVTFNIWWGNNAVSYRLYENNEVIDEGYLEANSPNAQSKTFSIEKTENGTYEYKIDLTNGYGTTSSNTISVNVTQAAQTPEVPTEDTVQTPVFSQAGGTYIKAQSVQITCKTPDAVIRYTTDGTEPTKDSTVYTKAISIEKDTVLKAKAFKDGMKESAVVSAEYIIKTGGAVDPENQPQDFRRDC